MTEAPSKTEPGCRRGADISAVPTVWQKCKDSALPCRFQWQANSNNLRETGRHLQWLRGHQSWTPSAQSHSLCKFTQALRAPCLQDPEGSVQPGQRRTALVGKVQWPRTQGHHPRPLHTGDTCQQSREAHQPRGALSNLAASSGRREEA